MKEIIFKKLFIKKKKRFYFNHNNIISRKNHPEYPERLYVPDNKVKWEIDFEYYDELRPYFIHFHVIKNILLNNENSRKWAESDKNINYNEIKNRITFINGKRETLEEAGIIFLDNNLPLNPIGRTGLAGPGLLGKNGPNHAADPIFTRWSKFTIVPFVDVLKENFQVIKKNKYNIFKISFIILIKNFIKGFILMFPHLQMIAIVRKDCGSWAIPGGMVEAGDTVSETLRKEINEEACNNMECNNFSEEIDEIFKKNKGKVIYKGYVDDPRNTDTRWIESTVVHYHCPNTIAKKIKLEAGDDAKNVAWVSMLNIDNKYKNFYSSHKQWTNQVVFNKTFIPTIIISFTIVTIVNLL